MRATLPAGVIGPYFNDEFGDVYGSIFALSADGFSQEEVRQHAEAVRAELLHVPDVAKVELFGVQTEKIFIEISYKRLAQLGIDFSPGDQLSSAHRTRSRAPGVLSTGGEEPADPHRRVSSTPSRR